MPTRWAVRSRSRPMRLSIPPASARPASGSTTSTSTGASTSRSSRSHPLRRHAGGAAPLEQPVSAKIVLVERPRYRLRYGLAVSDEEIGPDERDRRLGVAADLENRNLFGRGMTAGVSLRLRRDQKVGRFTLGAKRLFGVPIRSTLFLERQREQLNPEGASPITSDVTALSAEQAYRIRRAIELRYGYRIERNHTFIRNDGPIPSISRSRSAVSRPVASSTAVTTPSIRLAAGSRPRPSSCRDQTSAPTCRFSRISRSTHTSSRSAAVWCWRRRPVSAWRERSMTKC